MRKRSIQEWEKSVETLKNNCKRIISLSKSIRYVGVINEYGRTLSGSLKSGIKPMFSRQQVRDEFFAISSFMKLRSKPITAIGELNYILLNHQKVNSLVLSNKIITYYITFPKDTIPSEVLIKKISKVIMQA
jgi:hypothetical protein|tara:strand:+ start:936 stop:1331 length:396 start_codon:yes stop_codon:yes gene_type:complete